MNIDPLLLNLPPEPGAQQQRQFQQKRGVVTAGGASSRPHVQPSETVFVIPSASGPAGNEAVLTAPRPPGPVSSIYQIAAGNKLSKEHVVREFGRIETNIQTLEYELQLVKNENLMLKASIARTQGEMEQNFERLEKKYDERLAALAIATQLQAKAVVSDEDSSVDESDGEELTLVEQRVANAQREAKTSAEASGHSKIKVLIHLLNEKMINDPSNSNLRTSCIASSWASRNLVKRVTYLLLETTSMKILYHWSKVRKKSVRSGSFGTNHSRINATTKQLWNSHLLQNHMEKSMLRKPESTLMSSNKAILKPGSSRNIRHCRKSFEAPLGKNQQNRVENLQNLKGTIVLVEWVV